MSELSNKSDKAPTLWPHETSDTHSNISTGTSQVYTDDMGSYISKMLHSTSVVQVLNAAYFFSIHCHCKKKVCLLNSLNDKKYNEKWATSNDTLKLAKYTHCAQFLVLPSKFHSAVENHEGGHWSIDEIEIVSECFHILGFLREVPLFQLFPTESQMTTKFLLWYKVLGYLSLCRRNYSFGCALKHFEPVLFYPNQEATY